MVYKNNDYREYMQKLSLNVKLLLGFSICAALLLGIGLYSIYSIHSIELDYQNIVNKNYPEAIEAEELKNHADKAISLVLHINQPEQLESEKTRLNKKLLEEVSAFEKLKAEYADKVDSIVKENKQEADKYLLLAKEKVDASQKVAHKCEKIFDEIVSNTSVVYGLSEDIVVASNEQFQGIEQITLAIDQINVSTGSNSQISNTVSHASKEMANQSNTIGTVINELNNTVYGKKGAA